MARKKRPGFEEALTQLEEIVERLESDELTLDESLKLFEQGVALTRLTQKTLEEAEQKIQVLGEPLKLDAEAEDLPDA